MSASVDRQIVASLDQLHHEATGMIKPCRWSYSGGQDTYSCPHIKLTGREVIDRVSGFNHFTGASDANITRI